MINWDKLRENYSLEDFYNILYRNQPHRNSKKYKDWDYLESIAYEELLIEDERPNECELIIDKIIEYLKNEKTEELKNYDN